VAIWPAKREAQSIRTGLFAKWARSRAAGRKLARGPRAREGRVAVLACAARHAMSRSDAPRECCPGSQGERLEEPRAAAAAFRATNATKTTPHRGLALMEPTSSWTKKNLTFR
jgi:hypothetical protein